MILLVKHFWAPANYVCLLHLEIYTHDITNTFSRQKIVLSLGNKNNYKSLVFPTFTPVVRPYCGDRYPRYQLPVCVDGLTQLGKVMLDFCGKGTHPKLWHPRPLDRREIPGILARTELTLFVLKSASSYFPICVHLSPIVNGWHLPVLKAQLQWSLFRDASLSLFHLSGN